MGKSIYLTDKQIEFLRRALDAMNMECKEEEDDYIRIEILNKVSK